MRKSFIALFLLFISGAANAGFVLTLDDLQGFKNCELIFIGYPSIFDRGFHDGLIMECITLPLVPLIDPTLIIFGDLNGIPGDLIDIETLLGLNQVITIMTPDEFDYMNIPEPTSCLFVGEIGRAHV